MYVHMYCVFYNATVYIRLLHPIRMAGSLLAQHMLIKCVGSSCQNEYTTEIAEVCGKIQYVQCMYIHRDHLTTCPNSLNCGLIMDLISVIVIASYPLMSELCVLLENTLKDNRYREYSIGR